MSARPLRVGRVPVPDSSNTDSSLIPPSKDFPGSLPAHSWEELAHRAKYRAQQLARLCKVSLRTLERHFRLQHKQNVRDWLRFARIRYAYQAMLAGQSAKEAAYNSGFKQPSHFSREFKSHFGFSPSVVRIKPDEQALKRISFGDPTFGKSLPKRSSSD